MEYQNIVSDHKRAERFGKLMMLSTSHLETSITHNTSNPQLRRGGLHSKEEAKDQEFEEEEAFDDIDLDKISQEGEEEGEED